MCRGCVYIVYTYGYADELSRVDGGVDLVGRLLVVVRKVLQTLALLIQLLHCLVECWKSDKIDFFHSFIGDEKIYIQLNCHQNRSRVNPGITVHTQPRPTAIKT